MKLVKLVSGCVYFLTPITIKKTDQRLKMKHLERERLRRTALYCHYNEC